MYKVNLQKQIQNPYKVNWRLYVSIGGLSVLAMVIAIAWDNYATCILSGTMENLALGCVASVIIALLIEIGNVKDKNIKANNIYDAVYSDLKFQIMWFIASWAELCCVAYKDVDYYKEKHKWTEWYELTRNKYAKCDEKQQFELMHFFRDELMQCVDGVERAINQIEAQQYLLNINDICNQQMENILKDFSFEFRAAKMNLDGNLSVQEFWKGFDAINDDLENYINNWVDIKYYNFCRFKPYKFHEDSYEIARAIVASDGITLDSSDIGENGK